MIKHWYARVQTEDVKITALIGTLENCHVLKQSPQSNAFLKKQSTTLRNLSSLLGTQEVGAVSLAA